MRSTACQRLFVELNPHCKSMGNLCGSEYWTHSLPRRAGPEAPRRVTGARLPMGVDEAAELGLIDAAFDLSSEKFLIKIKEMAEQMANTPEFPERMIGKRRRREQDENLCSLEAYRTDEPAKLLLNFCGFDSSCHVARYNFVRKVPKSRTPLYLAAHRRKTGWCA